MQKTMIEISYTETAAAIAVAIIAAIAAATIAAGRWPRSTAPLCVQFVDHVAQFIGVVGFENFRRRRLDVRHT